MPFNLKPFAMKKLLLFLLVFMGLFSMAQENTFMEQYKGMPLKMHRADLYFGDAYKAPGSHLLTDEDLKTLLGNDLFDQYDSGRVLYYTGKTLKTVGYVASGLGLAYTTLLYIAWDNNISGFLNDFQTKISASTLFDGIGAIIVGSCLYRPGKEKLESVLEQFNEDKQNVIFVLSPTLIRCQLPQSDPSTALGLSLSIGF